MAENFGVPVTEYYLFTDIASPVTIGHKLVYTVYTTPVN